MATTMAMMAHTLDSRPMEMPGQHRRRRPGAGRLGDLLHRALLGGGEVLGDEAGGVREHDAEEHRPEDLQVVHVELGDEERPDEGEDGPGAEAPVDRRHGGLVVRRGPARSRCRRRR